MTCLYDRMFGDIPAGERIPVHYIRAALQLYIDGLYSSTKIKDMFSMDDDSFVSLSVIIGVLDDISTIDEKNIWLQKFENVSMMTEGGLDFLTETEWAQELGLV